MESKMYSARHSSKKLLSSIDKKKSKKKRKNKKGSKKDSDPGTDPDTRLEIEGVRALDNMPGQDSDSSEQIPAGDAASLCPAPNLQLNTENSIRSQQINASSLQDLQPSDGSTAKKRSSPSPSTVASLSNIRVKEVESNYSNLSLHESVSSASTMSSKRNSTKPSRSKNNLSKAGHHTGAKNNKKGEALTLSIKTNGKTENSSSSVESLRWDNALENEELERQRIEVYKINRRKRYLAAAQAKGLGWAMNYGANGSPVSEDSGIEMHERESHAAVTDFSTIKSLAITSQTNSSISRNEFTLTG
ncbi:hypothetical protein CHS0354_032787 [Potamilus streckersoni]|uniref:Uncharacterized protein n=1 Tax=Potamilus streckersoni TaxID=2493646 RepID=A0AAE0S8Y0_9BIVA|nr:hypothetical protein CHS0354_032787 [Potamilus streckersoni]